MNLNKGCIEINAGGGAGYEVIQMNLNKGCIEISLVRQLYLLWLLDEP